MSDIRAWSVEASGYAQWLPFKRPGEKLLSDQAPEPLPWLEDFWQQTLMAPIALPTPSTLSRNTLLNRIRALQLYVREHVMNLFLAPFDTKEPA